ncbi:MAG: phenylacetate-CoA oxygenase subunit PaaI [Flavobacteriaceae bacterium]|nr:phenylacetate-CoA oxygenase subunit PaaI [Flavobacteriaceae bacterium]
MEFTQKHVLGLKELLYKMADDQLILGHRNSEWTGLGPMLEEDISFSSMAQDKIGQSLALFELLQELGESDPDTVAFTRNDNQFHCSQFVELPIGGYDFSLVRHFFFDHAEAIRFEMLADTVFEPLAMVAKKFKGEIKYHTMHADIFMKKLAEGGPESYGLIQQAINENFGLALGIFEPGEYESELIEAGIFGGENALQSRWLAKVVPLLESFGYTVPKVENTAPALGGRKGIHTHHLQPLLDEMTEVFSIDPGADW